MIKRISFTSILFCLGMLAHAQVQFTGYDSLMFRQCDFMATSSCCYTYNSEEFLGAGQSFYKGVPDSTYCYDILQKKSVKTPISKQSLEKCKDINRVITFGISAQQDSIDINQYFSLCPKIKILTIFSTGNLKYFGINQENLKKITAVTYIKLNEANIKFLQKLRFDNLILCNIWDYDEVKLNTIAFPLPRGLFKQPKLRGLTISAFITSFGVFKHYLKKSSIKMIDLQIGDDFKGGRLPRSFVKASNLEFVRITADKLQLDWIRELNRIKKGKIMIKNIFIESEEEMKNILSIKNLYGIHFGFSRNLLVKSKEQILELINKTPIVITGVGSVIDGENNWTKEELQAWSEIRKRMNEIYSEKRNDGYQMMDLK